MHLSMYDISELGSNTRTNTYIDTVEYLTFYVYKFQINIWKTIEPVFISNRFISNRVLGVRRGCMELRKLFFIFLFPKN